MGSTTPKTERDIFYRRLVADWLERVMADHGLTKGSLAQALGVDRSIASRYLSQKVRPPLQRLQALERSRGIAVPQEVTDAWWLSEGPPTPPAVPYDLENEIRRVADDLRDVGGTDTRAEAKRRLEELIAKLA